jgi:hypothetical protein
MKIRYRLAAIASAVALAGAGALLTGQGVAYASAQNCGTNVANLVTECTAVNGSGLHINSLSGWATHLWADLLSYPSVHVELYGPAGHIKNCATISDFSPGMTTPTCTWSPNANKKAGNYCSRTWSLIGTKWEILATECIYVHA